MTVFYRNFLALCARDGITPSAAANRIGLSRAAATGWKNGKDPSDVTITKLAEEFGVSFETLAGRKKETPTIPSDGGVDERMNSVWDQLTESEKEYFFSQIDNFLKLRGQ